MNTTIEPSWKAQLQDSITTPSYISLKDYLSKEKEAGKIIYPPSKNILYAFEKTPFEAVKVVILGQDPYHGNGQAMGLSFSVPEGVKLPPSLQNIYKELEQDLGIPKPSSGDLTHWAEQGVLLLNAALTVRANEPASHANIGWQEFTNGVISAISAKKQNVVFLLWGKFAQSKKALIDSSKHLILEAAHPSPFSAYNGFFGCKHFSKTNEYLKENGIKSINW